jgi:hypothetical protein
MEVEALFGIRKTRFYAMQAFDGRFFRCGKTTQPLLDAFNQTYRISRSGIHTPATVATGCRGMMKKGKRWNYEG